MGDWNTGSVTDQVFNLVDNVPAGISGALPTLVNLSVQYVNTYTGQSISSTSIPDKYQGPVLYLTIAKAARLMSLTGTDKGFSIGDLSVDSSSGDSSTEKVADGYEKMARDELSRLGTYTRYGRTY